MPELPDVEAIRRYLLASGLVESRVTGVALGWPRASPGHEPGGVLASGFPAAPS